MASLAEAKRRLVPPGVDLPAPPLGGVPRLPPAHVETVIDTGERNQGIQHRLVGDRARDDLGAFATDGKTTRHPPPAPPEPNVVDICPGFPLVILNLWMVISASIKGLTADLASR